MQITYNNHLAGFEAEHAIQKTFFFLAGLEVLTCVQLLCVKKVKGVERNLHHYKLLQPLCIYFLYLYNKVF